MAVRVLPSLETVTLFVDMTFPFTFALTVRSVKAALKGPPALATDTP
jgi:hypothetical protein